MKTPNQLPFKSILTLLTLSLAPLSSYAAKCTFNAKYYDLQGDNTNAFKGRGKVLATLATNHLGYTVYPKDAKKTYPAQDLNVSITAYGGNSQLRIESAEGRTYGVCRYSNRYDDRSPLVVFNEKMEQGLLPTCAQIQTIKQELEKNPNLEMKEVNGCAGFIFPENKTQPVRTVDSLRLVPPSKSDLEKESFDYLRQLTWTKLASEAVTSTSDLLLYLTVDLFNHKSARILTKRLLDEVEESLAKKDFRKFYETQKFYRNAGDLGFTKAFPYATFNTKLVDDNPDAYGALLQGKRCKLSMGDPETVGESQGSVWKLPKLFTSGRAFEKGDEYGIYAYHLAETSVSFTFTSMRKSPESFTVECKGRFNNFGEVSDDLGGAVTFKALMTSQTLNADYPVGVKKLLRSQEKLRAWFSHSGGSQIERDSKFFYENNIKEKPSTVTDKLFGR
jgi:hypothetical protein